MERTFGTMEGNERGQQGVKQWRQRAGVWSLPTAAHSSFLLPCTLSGVTAALNALHHTVQTENCLPPVNTGMLRGVPGKRLGEPLITVCQVLLPGLSWGCFCLILAPHSGTSFPHMTT